MARETPTRWERVRRILDGGVGRPWRLPLAELETVEVYGAPR